MGLIKHTACVAVLSVTYNILDRFNSLQNYSDSSYEIITCDCSAYYNDGTVDYGRIYFDSEEFENFINCCLTLTEILQ